MEVGACSRNIGVPVAGDERDGKLMQCCGVLHVMVLSYCIAHVIHENHGLQLTLSHNPTNKLILIGLPCLCLTFCCLAIH